MSWASLNIFLILSYYVLLILRRSSWYSLFSPNSVVFLFILIFYSIPTVLGLNILSVLLDGVSIESSSRRMNFVIFMLISALLLRPKLRNNRQLERVKSKYYGDSLVIICLILYVCVLLSLGKSLIFNLFTSRGTSAISMELRNGGALRFFVIATAEFIPLVYLLYTRRVKKIILFVLVIISSIFIIALGARSLLVSMILSLIFYYMSIKALSLRNLLFAGFSAAALFLIVSSNRSGKSNLGEYLLNNLDQVISTLVVIDKIDKSEVSYQYGSTLVDAVYFFIPSSLYPNKPKSYAPSRLIYPEMISRGVSENTRHTMNFGIIGRSYLEFGIFGVVVLGVFFSYLLDILFLRIKDSRFRSNEQAFLFIFSYSHIHQLILLGWTSHYYSIVLFNWLLFSVIIGSIWATKEVLK